MSLSLTQKWLKQVIAPYPNRDQVYLDVDSVLAAHPTLRPKNDVYTFNDGRAQLLLCVHGLIPITFRQATYNIPIAIWIPLEYPKLPPLVYVVPTSDMLVKSSKHVDPSGECSFEYLDNWRRKSEGCNLRSLIELMQEHFSRDPPVYAKPKNSAPPPAARPSSVEPQMNRPTPPRPPPPPPSTLPQPMPAQQEPIRMPTPVASARSNSPPPRPPKVFSPQISPSSPAGSASSPARPSPLSTSFPSQPPPLRPQFPPNPPGPPPPPAIPGRQGYQPTHNRSNSLASSAVSGSHLAAPPPVQSPPNVNNRWSMPPHPGGPNLPLQPQPPPPPPPSAYQPHTNQHPVILAAPAPTPIINIPAPPVPRPNFLDEDESTTQVSEAPPSPNAPPRPMNPELLRLHHDLHSKITAELGALGSALAADTERLRATQADLLAGEPAIRDEMARLEAVRSVCAAVGDRLDDVVTRAEANVQSLKSKGDPEVDELVCSTAIVYNQLVDLVAEDKAIEDTIYHLHRALNSGRIDLDRFIRTVRILAQEQFMKRALVEKINEGLPIGARFHQACASNFQLAHLLHDYHTMAVPIAEVFIGNVVHTPILGQIEILHDHVILVDVNGIIAEVCPLAVPSPGALHYLNSMPPAAITRLPPTSFFTPSFIDLHLHAPQFLYLGTGLHLPLLIWLDEYAYRAEERLDSDPELARKACYGVQFMKETPVLAQRLAENGTGAVLAFGTINEDTNIILAEAFQAVGLRAFVGKLSMDQSSRPSYRESSTSASLVSARSFIRRCRGLVSSLPVPLRLVEPVLTPRFVPTCSDAVLRGLSLISRGENVKIQSHLAEAHDQIDYVRQSRGKSDIDIFHDAGLLSPRAIFAHCTFLEIPELSRLREAGSAVAHCPLSNAYFSTLPFRLREALDMGLKVGLGTDVAGGYQVDIMSAMRQSVITSRMRNGFQTELVPGDAPFSIDWKESLYLATRGGAISLNLNAGVIQPGAPFDVQRIDFFNGVGEGLGDMDFFDIPTVLTEPLVEKWWCLGNSANRLNMWVQGRKIF